MTITIKMLATMYGVTDMYTQLRVLGKDGKTAFADAGTFRKIVRAYPDQPLVRWSYSVEDGQAFIELIGRG